MPLGEPSPALTLTVDDCPDREAGGDQLADAERASCRCHGRGVCPMQREPNGNGFPEATPGDGSRRGRRCDPEHPGQVVKR